jgi:enolase
MKTAVASLDAFEILDSRGWPTLRVVAELQSGDRGVASVPSGASTGRHEAIELRDQDLRRYQGKGVLTAASNVRTRMQPHLKGRDAINQELIDRVLVELDGMENKSNLGANAMLGASMAIARAAASAQGRPLLAGLTRADFQYR